ncbi:uncharacterized protein LOC122498313 [Leptopilina heterotoma]|uniref:uncharacterized protein LOC122498313 n=1 Tax=Leptopilina heterotoma TaxID=63436 RepID=UPI001CA9AD80|nr:uncharacterized protein LOC122498313 [Leptopilina heterotoma]
MESREVIDESEDDSLERSDTVLLSSNSGSFLADNSELEHGNSGSSQIVDLKEDSSNDSHDSAASRNSRSCTNTGVDKNARRSENNNENSLRAEDHHRPERNGPARNSRPSIQVAGNRPRAVD